MRSLAHRSLPLLSLVTLPLLTTACVGPWPGTDFGITLENAKAGFVYVGPVGDHGWTKTHDDGRLAVEENLGIPTEYVPSVSPADGVSTLDTLVANGNNLLFTTSFDFVSATQQAAANHPEALFFNCSGGVYADNLGSYMGRMYQPMYLAGMVAGSVTQTNRLGLVLSVPIPEIVRHANAFTLGAREVNPDVVVEVAWVNNWFDAELEPELTNQLIQNGADIISNQTDTTIPLETAAGQTVTVDDGAGGTTEIPVYSIGYDNPDSCSFAPDTCLTSAYWNWGPMYTSLIESVIDGSWKPEEIIWEQMKATPSESAVHLSEFSTLVPGAVRLAVDARIPDLVDPAGSQLPFVGPINDVLGEQRVGAGDSLDDDALNRMCWFVDGVITHDAEDGDVPAEVPAGCGGDF